jgi:uncharacterized protein (TIGR03643 family)
MPKKLVVLDEVTTGEVIDMALSDHVSFTAIEDLFGLNADQVKTLMRANLRPARYRAWRNRVQVFGERRTHYKDDTFRPSKTVPMPTDDYKTDDYETEDEIAPVRKRKSNPKRALAKP